MSDIPIEELEELCRWFRETSDDKRKEGFRVDELELEAAHRGQADAWMSAANRLNALIEEYETDAE